MKYFAAGVTLESTGLLNQYSVYELYKPLNEQSLYIIGGNYTELNEDMIITPSYKNSKYEIADRFRKSVNNLPEQYQINFPNEFYVFEEERIHMCNKLFIIKIEKLLISKQESNNIIQSLKVWRQ